jgi:hypothetical protein
LDDVHSLRVEVRMQKVRPDFDLVVQLVEALAEDARVLDGLRFLCG